MFDAIGDLTAGMAAGDRRAVEVFYRRYFDMIYAHAKHLTRRDEAFCLDVVQDTVLRVVRTVRRADTEAQFRAWLRLVTQTTAFDQLKGESRRRKRESVFAIAHGPEDYRDNDIEERLAWLNDRITRLDPALIELIELRFHRSWTLARIAQSMGLSIATIDGRLRRALHKLRDTAASESDDE